MANPVISVVVMIDNAQRHKTLRSLQSLLAQTYDNIEIIVAVTDRAYTKAAESLEEDFGNDDRFRFILHISDSDGQCFRNKIISQAYGEYIAFMNSGEIWSPEKLACQLSLFTETTFAVYCNGIGFKEQKRENFFTDGFELSDWTITRPIKTSGQILYKTDAIKEVDYFDNNLTELCDIDMLLRLRKIGTVMCCEQLLEEYDTTYDTEMKRREFNEQESFLKRKSCVSELVKNKQDCFDFYESLIKLAREAKMPIETVQYSAILFLRLPLLTVKKCCRSVLRRLNIVHKNNSERFICSEYISRIRKFLKGKTKDYPLLSDRKAIKRHANEILSDCKLSKNFHNGELIISKDASLIEERAFAGCSGITRVIIPAEVRAIEPYAFAGCTDLEEVIFTAESKLTCIGDYAFAGCGNLINVLLPGNVSVLGRGAFIGCISLKNIEFCPTLSSGEINHAFANNIECIPAECFAGCVSLKEIVFTGSSLLRDIGSYSFFGCTKLERIRIDSSLCSVGSHAFENCSNLTEALISRSDDVKSIGNCAFKGCSELIWFTLPSDLAMIPYGAFKDCVSLRSITIPWGVKHVKHGAFTGCKNLYACTVQNPITHISSKAFDIHTEITQNRYKDIESK